MAPKKKPTASKKAKGGEGKSEAARSSETPFRFLELPAELRNEIYALVCGQEAKAFLVPQTHGNLACKLPLLHTIRQLRQECLPILCATAKEINATVHIIRFFNRCDNSELKMLAKSTALDSNDRTMTITIELKDNFHYFVDRLHRWIKRIAKTTKKGTDVQVGWHITSESRDAIYRFGQVVNEMGLQYPYREPLDVLDRLYEEYKRAGAAWIGDNLGH